jgi:hypothetical protein
MNQPDKPEPSPVAPVWQVPLPLGQQQALQSMGTVAAPVLAGFSLSLIALTISVEDSIRWPSLALLLLVCATVAMLISVQTTFWARRYAVTPADMIAWWPDYGDDPMRRELLRREQSNSSAAEQRWSKRASAFYNGGLLVLLVGIGVMLIPPGTLCAINGFRVAAVVIVMLAALGEAAWIVAATRGWLEPTYD